MEINFCDVCDNLMFLYSDPEKQVLYYGCKTCGGNQENSESKCIYNNTYNIDLSETINTNKFLAYDITLPSIVDNQNIICPNKDCKSHSTKGSEIAYIKYDGEKMKYMYICKVCDQKWTNQ